MLRESLTNEHNHIPKKRWRVSEEQRQHLKLNLGTLMYHLSSGDFPSDVAFHNLRNLAHHPEPFVRALTFVPRIRIVLTTAGQLELFERFGDSYLLIDSAQDLIQEKLVLTTLMVATPNGTAVPVAWFISEDLVEQSYDFFFDTLFDLCKRPVFPERVVGDFDQALSNAVSRKFGTVYRGDPFYFCQANYRWLQAKKSPVEAKELTPLLRTLYESPTHKEFQRILEAFKKCFLDIDPAYLSYFEREWIERTPPHPLGALGSQRLPNQFQLVRSVAQSSAPGSAS